ncbi:hypothetical protein F4604DRAFT_1784860 [Suillus subluteus]|nr:hypothetical protein F4604DRAFT_1784860 [Suillus subluteus]
MTEDGDKTTKDTLFHMASVSKAFCVSALGILMDDYEHGRNVTPLPLSNHPTYNVRLPTCHYALALEDILHVRTRSPTILGYDITFPASYSSAQ